MSDPHDLDRFVTAQARNYTAALQEIRDGAKRSHWMWYVFPQLRGLGMSPAAQLYGIRDLEEAAAYLSHPLLGSRLRECAEALLGIEGSSAREIFGGIDTMKLCSSATLFALVSPPGSVFAQVLDKYFAGERDAKTLALLGKSAAGD